MVGAWAGSIEPASQYSVVIPGPSGNERSSESITTACDYGFRARATDLGFTRDGGASIEPKSAKAGLVARPSMTESNEEARGAGDQRSRKVRAT